MNKLLVIISLLTLNSCFLLKENGIDIEIKNNSDLTIENVKFYTSENLAVVLFDKIEPNQIVKNFLSMKDNHVDGSYILEYNKSGGEKEYSGGGYYTNGGSLNELVQFEIKKDTTLVKFTSDRY